MPEDSDKDATRNEKKVPQQRTKQEIKADKRAAALRANLTRRKSQQKARKDDD